MGKGKEGEREAHSSFGLFFVDCGKIFLLTRIVSCTKHWMMWKHQNKWIIYKIYFMLKPAEPWYKIRTPCGTLSNLVIKRTVALFIW
jgi:hypothetical protein